MSRHFTPNPLNLNCAKNTFVDHVYGTMQRNEVSQSESVVPGGVEATFDGFGLLLALTLGIWDQLEFDVGV